MSLATSGPALQVLVVDDDAELRARASRALVDAGFDVIAAETRAAARVHAAERTVDAAVLELELPDATGFDLLDELRGIWPNLYVVIAAGAGRVEDRVAALRHGADDYLVKPYSVAELAARLSSFDRRRRGASEVIDHDTIRIHPSRRLAIVRGVSLDLTRREFDLLAYLAANPRTVFTRGELLSAVWGSSPSSQAEATVTEHIRRLRAKIDAVGGPSSCIITMRGSGYTFDPEVVDLRDGIETPSDAPLQRD